MDLKSFAEAYQSVYEGKVNPGLQAYLDKKKGKKDDGDEKEEKNGNGSKGSKPDFLDLDKDGDKKEPMKKAAKEKNMKKEEVQQMDEFVASAMGALNTANKIANVANTGLTVANTIKNTMKKKKDEDEMEEAAVAEHHQKDADGKVIEHEDTTPSSVEEKTVLEQLIENGREIDAFEAVISYLIDEGFAKSWEEAQDIMVTLKPELVEEVYQNQLRKI